MVAGDVVHPDKEVDVQAGPQNDREEARPAVPDGQEVVRRAKALLGGDAAAAGQYTPGKLSRGVMGEGAGVNKLSGGVLQHVETGLCGGVKSKAVGLCVGILS